MMSGGEPCTVAGVDGRQDASRVLLSVLSACKVTGRAGVACGAGCNASSGCYNKYSASIPHKPHANGELTEVTDVRTAFPRIVC
jgi:hypothetical protein